MLTCLTACSSSSIRRDQARGTGFRISCRARGSGDPSVCGGYGPNCPPSAAAVVGGAVATAFLASLLPAAMGFGGWLHVRAGESAGLVILGFTSVLFGAIGVLNYVAGGYLALPSAALGVVAFFAGVLRGA